MRIIKKTSDQQFQTIGQEVVTGLTNIPFGSLSKSEIDLLLFRALVTAGVVKLDDSNFEVARQLQVPVAKVQALKFALRIRDSDVDENALLFDGVHFVRSSSTAETLVFSIEDRFTREVAISRLKVVSTFTDSSFNRERLIVAKDDFGLFVNALFPDKHRDLTNAVKKMSDKKNLSDVGDVLLKALWGVSGSFAVGLLRVATGI